MFWNLFKYQMKITFRNREVQLWSIIFPIALGTLFFVAFGSVYDNTKMKTIDIATVYALDEDCIVDDMNISSFIPEGTEEMIWNQMCDQLAYDEDTKMLSSTVMGYDEALEALNNKEVDGVYVIHNIKDIELMVLENGLNPSILSEILTGYRQNFDIMTAGGFNMSPEVTGNINSYVQQNSLAGENKDPYVCYFYNLIAMTCLMSIGVGSRILPDLKANHSAYGVIGMRQEVSPASQTAMWVASFLARTFSQMLVAFFTLFYLIVVLGVNFGGSYGHIILVTVLATIMGISIGLLIGNLQVKDGTLTGITMLIVCGGGFLSGLMFGQMKYLVEINCPIINRINPSAIITDAFYCINIVGIGARYYRSIITMVAVSVIALIVTAVIARKQSYKAL